MHEDGQKIRPGSTPWRDGVSARATLYWYSLGLVRRRVWQHEGRGTQETAAASASQLPLYLLHPHHSVPEIVSESGAAPGTTTQGPSPENTEPPFIRKNRAGQCNRRRRVSST